jgi:hypothetical protein
MAYGSDGSDYPDYGPPTPRTQPSGRARPEPGAAQQEPYYGDAPRPPRNYGNRPEPYDPYQTRAREQSAGQRGGPGQDPYAGEQDPRGRGQRRPARDQYDPNQSQHARASLDTAAYDTGAYNDRGRRGPAAQDGDPYGSDARPGDGYDDPRRDPRSRGRAADRLGATSLVEEDPAARPGDPADPAKSGGRASRRKGKKVVPPHVRRRRKIVRRSLLGVFLLLVGYLGVTMYPYLTAPGTDTISARIAEWGRDHHLSWAVTWLENATYKAPPTGGALSSSQLAQLQGAPVASPTGPAAAKAELPANITPLAAGTVPGEGVWHSVTTNAAGVPIVEKAALRPDAQHTSDLAYVVWMNQTALKFNLHPGYQQPGGTWKTPSTVPAGQRTGLVATWNGGFKIKPDDALGGFYAEGRTAQPLVNGKAAEVFYQDGSMKIGQWGRDETMTSQVSAVRQNLSLLVDKGQVTVGPGDGSSAMWGYTIKNSYFIARSGVGMTAKGDIVYVSGRFLSVYTMAKLLAAAGAVYGMELDINPDWVSFMSYGGPDPANPTPTKLWDFVQPADRYFQPSDRDFVAVFTR